MVLNRLAKLYTMDAQKTGTKISYQTFGLQYKLKYENCNNRRSQSR